MGIIELILAVIIGGILMGCSIFVLFSPFMLLVWLAKGLPGGSRKTVKDEVVQAQWEYDRKFRRRD